jgi:hypothetical protein
MPVRRREIAIMENLTLCEVAQRGIKMDIAALVTDRKHHDRRSNEKLEDEVDDAFQQGRTVPCWDQRLLRKDEVVSVDVPYRLARFSG